MIFNFGASPLLLNKIPMYSDLSTGRREAPTSPSRGLSGKEWNRRKAKNKMAKKSKRRSKRQ